MLSAGSFFRGKNDAAIKEKIPLTNDASSSTIISVAIIRKTMIFRKSNSIGKEMVFRSYERRNRENEDRTDKEDGCKRR